MESFNQNLKIVTTGISGNEGKSTICRHLLAPRIPNAELISVESVNSGGVGEAIRPENFVKIMERLILSESAIIDVGSSNIEEFLIRMDQQEGVHEDVDFFIFPVTTDEKQQNDLIRTIRCFKAVGVPCDKMIILFNKVKPNEKIKERFPIAIQAAISEGVLINPNAVFEYNEFYQLLKVAGLSVADIENDKTDYRAKITELKTEAARNKCVQMISLHRFYKKSAANLDILFHELFVKMAE